VLDYIFFLLPDFALRQTLAAFANQNRPDDMPIDSSIHYLKFYLSIMATIAILGGILMFWQREKKVKLSSGEEAILSKLNSLKNDIKSLKKSSSTVTNENNYTIRANLQEAELINNNVILNGIPQSINENLLLIVYKIGRACGIVIKLSDIESAIRLEPTTNSTSAPTTNEPAILVEFSNENVKTDLFNGLHNLISHKQFLNCNMIGLSSTKRIYINHQLSPDLQKVFDKALLHKRSANFKAVTTKSNGIAVKVNAEWIDIKSEQQLDQLIANAMTKTAPSLEL
jgi:hypothetical protein